MEDVAPAQEVMNLATGVGWRLARDDEVLRTDPRQGGPAGYDEILRYRSYSFTALSAGRDSPPYTARLHD